NATCNHLPGGDRCNTQSNILSYPSARAPAKHKTRSDAFPCSVKQSPNAGAAPENKLAIHLPASARLKLHTWRSIPSARRTAPGVKRRLHTDFEAAAYYGLPDLLAAQWLDERAPDRPQKGRSLIEFHPAEPTPPSRRDVAATR